MLPPAFILERVKPVSGQDFQIIESRSEIDILELARSSLGDI